MFTDAYWPRVNGVTVSVDTFSRALIKEGHEVLIVCSLYPSDYDTTLSIQSEKRADDPQILRVPSMPAFVTKEDRIAKFYKWNWVFKQIESFNPEIIHINTEVVIAEFGFFYAKAHNLPAIYTFHTMWEDYGPNYFPMFPAVIVKFVIRGVLKNILKRSYKVIVPTPQIDAVVHKYKPNTDTFLLPTGIDPALFNHEKVEVEAFREAFTVLFPEAYGKKLLLMAGRVVKEKNIGFLLKILPDILKKNPDTILVIVGNGPDMDFYMKEAKHYGVEASCVFTGYLERSQLSLIYAISDVFVFPSLTDTQGLVTIEAMFSGTPVVAIGALGTLMVMGGDNGGFMVKNNPDEFTARVLDLLNNEELYRQKSEEAKLHAKSWSIEEITKKLTGIYRETITSYIEDYGRSRSPVWELIMNKRWWKINNKIIKKKTKKKLQELHSKIKPLYQRKIEK
ncbi:MAG: glycosyltransferase [Treponema sp.]|jgi:glycosyltransferase involved in cell wall biosynthesis|nr:glycosyltransferase [Treponema sp.]